MMDIETIAFSAEDGNPMLAGCKRAAEIWRLIEGIVDEINAQVSEHYRIRLVHEDGSDFVEVIKIVNVQFLPEGDDDDNVTSRI